MSLYDEGLELDRMYQNCRADVEALQERCATLEQLVSDYQELIAKYDELSSFAPFPEEREALQQRATVLLHEGEVEPLQQEEERQS